MSLPGRSVQVERAGSGLPLVYLHSLVGEGYWTPFHEELAARFDVVVPAHPGYWDSSRPEGIETVEDVAFATLELLDALALERPVVVGASFGGWVAAHLAILRPELLRGVVLIDPIGLPPAEGDPLPEDIWALQPYEAAALLFEDPTVEAARFMAAVDLDDPPGAELVVPLLQIFETGARYAWMPLDDRLSARLTFADVPALVLWGSADRYVPPATADRWVARLPRARSSLVDGAGHLPALERPLATAEAVTDFVGSLPG